MTSATAALVEQWERGEPGRVIDVVPEPFTKSILIPPEKGIGIVN